MRFGAVRIVWMSLMRMTGSPFGAAGIGGVGAACAAAWPRRRSVPNNPAPAAATVPADIRFKRSRRSTPPSLELVSEAELHLARCAGQGRHAAEVAARDRRVRRAPD